MVTLGKIVRELPDWVAPTMRELTASQRAIVRDWAKEQDWHEFDGTIFDLAEGLYTFSTQWCDGQADRLYRVSCIIPFRPGRNWSGADEEDTPAAWDLSERLADTVRKGFSL